MRLFASVMLAIAVAGCDATGPSGTGIEDTWYGTNGDASVTLALAEDAGAVTGAGTIKAYGTTYPVSVTGTFYDNSALSLNAVVTGYGSATYTGTLNGNRIDGMISGIGLLDGELDLRRK